jgi:hypothetical protein
MTGFSDCFLNLKVIFVETTLPLGYWFCLFRQFFFIRFWNSSDSVVFLLFFILLTGHFSTRARFCRKFKPNPYILNKKQRNDLIWFIVFNATFSNISAISWRPVLVVEEARVPGENHRTWASDFYSILKQFWQCGIFVVFHFIDRSFLY